METVSSYSAANRLAVKVERYRVTSDYEPNEIVSEFVREQVEDFSNSLGYQIAEFGVDLDCKFESLRGKETNIGNFLADIMRTEYLSDFCIFTSGSVRLNQVI